ncbi:uncharacterized protein FFM5_02274 [Fusarium fujikuroi]|nr:uncharacterized protein FFM5_02274 [Fusarium fujikuroi]
MEALHRPRYMTTNVYRYRAIRVLSSPLPSTRYGLNNHVFAGIPGRRIFYLDGMTQVCSHSHLSYRTLTIAVKNPPLPRMNDVLSPVFYTSPVAALLIIRSGLPFPCRLHMPHPTAPRARGYNRELTRTYIERLSTRL